MRLRFDVKILKNKRSFDTPVISAPLVYSSLRDWSGTREFRLPMKIPVATMLRKRLGTFDRMIGIRK